MAYGVHSPFENSFWLQWQHPEAGDIVVFRYPENPEVFYVKRVVAVGGDELSVNKGIISVNGHPYSQVPIQMKPADNVFDYFEEKSTHPYVVRYKNRDSSFFDSVKVPAGSIFVMGDNRDQSNDSRYWGFVPEGNLLGTAKIVWLACEQTLPSAQFLCDPTTIRFDRLLKKLR